MWTTIIPYNAEARIFKEELPIRGEQFTLGELLEQIYDIGKSDGNGDTLPGSSGVETRLSETGEIRRIWNKQESALEYQRIVNLNYPELTVIIEEYNP